MDMVYDDIDEPVEEIQLSELVPLVEGYMNAEHEVEQLEIKLAEAKKRLAMISEETLPNYMAQFGVPEISFEYKGQVFKVGWKEDVRVSLPKEDLIARAEALQFLRDKGAESLIKEELNLRLPTELDKDQETALELARTTLNAVNLYLNSDTTVNANSLATWFREALGLAKNSVASIQLSEVKGLKPYIYKKTTLKKSV